MGVLSAFTGKLQRIRPFQLLPEQELYVREHGTFRNYLINSSPPPPLHKSQPRNTIRANPAAAPRRAPGAQRAAPAAPGTRGAAPARRENPKQAQARPGRAPDPRGTPRSPAGQLGRPQAHRESPAGAPGRAPSLAPRRAASGAPAPLSPPQGFGRLMLRPRNKKPRERSTHTHTHTQPPLAKMAGKRKQTALSTAARG